MTSPRVYCKDFTLQLDGIKATGALLPMRQSEESYKLCTPDLKPVRQIYVDILSGKQYEKEDLGRAIEEEEDGGKVLKPVPLDSIIKAKKSLLPKNILELSVRPKAEVMSQTFPSSNQGYVFQPVARNAKGKVVLDKINDRNYQFISAILSDSDVVLVGKCNLQNHEGFFILSLFNGHICLHKHLYPEDLNDITFEAPSLSEKVREQASQAAKKLTRSFDPSEFENEIKRRLEQVNAGQFDPEPDEEADLLDLLNSYA